MKFSELQRLQRMEGITVLSADERIEQLEARLRTITKERDALRAKIERMEQPESGFRERCAPASPAGGSNRFPLYDLPGAQPALPVAEQDQINAEAAIRSIYGARPNDEALWQTIANGMITPAHMAQAVADGTITPAYIMQPAPSVKNAIIDDLQSQFDSEGIAEHGSGDALIRLSDAIAAVEDSFAQPAPGAPWVSLAERMPNPDKHDRVLIYTEGYDFGGEQVFDVKAEALNECRYIDPDEQPETCKAASHWMPHPRNAIFDYAAHCAQPAPSVPTALLVAAADLIAQMEIVSRVGFIDTPNDKDSCAAFCVAEGTWLELMSCVESLASALAAAPKQETK